MLLFRYLVLNKILSIFKNEKTAPAFEILRPNLGCMQLAKLSPPPTIQTVNQSTYAYPYMHRANQPSNQPSTCSRMCYAVSREGERELDGVSAWEENRGWKTCWIDRSRPSFRSGWLYYTAWIDQGNRWDRCEREMLYSRILRKPDGMTYSFVFHIYLLLKKRAVYSRLEAKQIWLVMPCVYLDVFYNTAWH